jgi:hypothetical protein
MMIFPYVELTSDDWRAMRRDVLRRAGYRCEKCRAEQCDVYPRDGVSWDAQSDVLLVCLCSRCLRAQNLRRALRSIVARLT